MTTARILSRNLAANWIGHGSSMLVLFFLSPFVIATLGNVQYGIWSLLTVLTGYMGILDLGVRASTGRHVALYIGKKNHKAVDETIRTSLAFFTAIGIVVVAVGFTIGWVFPKAFSSVPIEYHGLIRILLPILALNMWITTFRSVLSSVLIAHDRFDISNGIDLFMLAIRTAGTIFVLTKGYGIFGLTLVVIACNMVGVLSTYFMTRRVYRYLRIWPLNFSIPRLREILGYGFAAFISAIAIKVIGQTDLVIVGAVISVEEVTIYSVGAMLIYYSSTFIQKIGTTFFPPVQRAIAKGEFGAARWLFFRQVRLSLLFGLPMYIGFIIFAEPFIKLWMLSPGFPISAVKKAAIVMGILAGSKILYLLKIGSDGIIAALGYIRFNAMIAISEACLNLGLSLLFAMSFDWGLSGIAAGTLVARIFVGTFFQPWYACQKAKISWQGFVTAVIGRGLIVGILFSLLCLGIKHLTSTDSWGIFWVQVVLSIIGYCPIAFFILLPGEDRKRLMDSMRVVFSRF